MKQEDLNNAMTFDPYRPPETIAIIVYNFLTELINKGNWLERQAIRTVRGLVKQWMDKHGVA